MKVFKILLFFLLIGSVKSYAQVDFSAKVQESTVEKKSYKLFFIDFWATWCGPCAYATTHINQIRDRFPSDLYVATISKEQPDLIKKYLKKHPNTLDVYSDFESRTFKRYNIRFLPNGILLNANGKILWEGSPSDFSSATLTRFLRKNRSEAKVSDLFHAHSSNKSSDKTYIPKKDFEIFTVNENSPTDFNIEKNDFYTKLTGSLSAILAHANSVVKSQIITNDNAIYNIYIKNDLLPFTENLVLSHLNLEKNIKNEKVETLVYNLDSSKLWDTNQINWVSQNESKYLITENDIEADNLTAFQFFTIISKELEMPFILEGNYAKNKKHDWQLHFKYYELMLQSLKDNFNIEVSKTYKEIPHYYIKKKDS